MRRRLPLLGTAEVITFFALLFAIFLTYSFYRNRMLPNTYINGVAVGGKTIEEAVPLVAASAPDAPSYTVTLSMEDIRVATDSGALDLGYNITDATHKAFIESKEGKFQNRLFALLSSPFSRRNYDLTLQFDNDSLVPFITDLKLEADIIGEYPAAELGVSGNVNTLVIHPGEPGRVVNLEEAAQVLQTNAASGVFSSEAPIASTSATLTENEIEAAQERAEKFVGYSVEFFDPQDPSNSRELSDQDLVALLSLPSGISEFQLETLISSWTTELRRPPQDAVFSYHPDTLEVSEFIPPRDGLELLEDSTNEKILSALSEIESLESQSTEEEREPIIRRELDLVKTPPQVGLADTNGLGIIERIGYGESQYDHSIPNRIHNVSLATERISNTIVRPGEEFSFNKTIGEISGRTGYRSAYIISGGRTTLGDGGGTCQVSTTVFRSALNAGLPISKRLQHSYRVSYYELDSKPGIDATVYSGDIDLRFINDTGQHILIHGAADSENLEMYIEIYGTSDGRTTEIVDHKTWGASSPLAPQYYPDSSLPPGTIRQIDWAAGGINASFTNVVRDADGNIVREEEYVSRYRPWAAKFLVGE